MYSHLKVLAAILDAILDLFINLIARSYFRWSHWIPWPQKPMNRHQYHQHW